ncbi:Glycosyl transferase [Cupriavidus taiwanensis]|uniref:Glycosyl transferase n=1 Tax=Cupriavidus taiwanensis TaxID=164546 RepID=A0A375I9S4_9BURK|nr:glycosyltransferase [Cupriavidus taiwanensis]SPK71377.1 Glycosyl transferase [Cupriavidus taiwanensis]
MALKKIHGAIAVKLVIEGEIPTTHIIGRLVREAIGTSGSVQQMFVPEFVPAKLAAHTLPLLIRVGDPGGRQMLKWMIRRDIPFLYYVDDNFWELKGDTPLAQYYQAPEVRATLEFAVRHAHTVIVNSPLLGTYLRDRFDSKVCVLRAPFDFSILDENCPRLPHPREVRVGFAGSVTREADFVGIIPALERILAEFSEVRFYFFGYCPPTLRNSNRVHFFRHVDNYEDFIRLKNKCALDIGLAPMADSDSNLYKTNNKYREYGALHVAGIYSDSPPYRDSVRHGENGLLIPMDADGWYEAIALLVRDQGLRERIAHAAYDDVREKYGQATVAAQWRELLLWFARECPKPTLSRRVIAADTVAIRIGGWIAKTRLRVTLKLLRIRALARRLVRRSHGD